MHVTQRSYKFNRVHIQILSKIGVNAYILEVPNDWETSATFNVEDLVKFQGSNSMPSNPFEYPSESEPKPQNSTTPNDLISHKSTVRQEQVEQILDEQVTLTKRGSYQRFLVK